MSRALLIALLLLLTSCSGKEYPWHGRAVAGMMPDLVFTLTDAAGHTVTADNYAGEVLLLYFGFTHCEDVCPTTLNTLTRALHELGAAADNARILFVSVDPQRDTPVTLQRYAAHFSPQVTALSGNTAQLDALTRRYRVAYGYGRPDANGDYEVYHSSAIFVFDRQGQVRLLLKESLGAHAIAEDLRHLIASANGT